jgi:hypothetical protein
MGKPAKPTGEESLFQPKFQELCMERFRQLFTVTSHHQKKEFGKNVQDIFLMLLWMTDVGSSLSRTDQKYIKLDRNWLSIPQRLDCFQAV